MKTFFRILGWIVGSIVALLAIGLAVGSVYYRDIPAAELEKKYANAESKFIMLDGVRMHYRDEGPRDAPTVVLIHAHFDSLLMWDPWVAALKDKYRVVRFDFTSHGLTGPDPSGNYTLKRTVDLFENLADELKLSTFSMAGTSMGGTIAMHYSSRHPDKVEKLILLSPGALNTRITSQDTPPPLPPGMDLLKIITPKMMFSGLLNNGYGDKSKVTDQLVTQWWEMMRREGQREAELTRTRQYVSGDVSALIRSLTQPTLIMWGEKNPVVAVDQAKKIVDLMTSAKSVRLLVYPGVGHMAVHEAPDLTAKDARAFFDETVAEAPAATTPPPG